MGLILGRQKRALMVIEPPGELYGGAVFEIDDDIFVSVKQFLLDELLVWLMCQTGVPNLGPRRDFFRTEAREDGCRSKPVKAVIVMKDSDSGHWTLADQFNIARAPP
jgi:hypothetical protein